MAIQEGPFSPQRIPQRVLNATTFFQCMIDPEVLAGRVKTIGKVWVNNIVIKRSNLLEVLAKFHHRGAAPVGEVANTAARKYHLFSRAVTWCGKVYSEDSIRHLLRRIEELINTHRLETDGRADADFPACELNLGIFGGACTSGGAAA